MPQRKAKASVVKKVEQNLNVVKKSFSLNPRFSILIVILVLIGLIYCFRGIFVAAVVNGETISRLSIIQSLEKQSGKQAVESEITKLLILSQAQKKNITVSQSEIDTQILTIEKSLTDQGQTLDSALAFQGMTKQDLVEQIRIQKIIEKILGKDISVSDKEIDDYIANNNLTTPDGSSDDEFKAGIKQQLEQQKMGEKFQTWIAEVQKSAKIEYYINY
ncbi:MAG: hypothetical protein ABH816_03235 [Candidatus Levyibacteriota bacterium]